MNIHEYQAKAILRDYGAPVAKGAVAFTPDEAVRAAEALPGPVYVVKAQIHAGGRGKGRFKEPEAGEKGGVRLARSVEEVGQFAKADARPYAGDAADRPARQDGEAPLYRGRLAPSSASFISPR